MNTGKEQRNLARVGVIGLGLIGSAWARNYDTDGLLVATWNRSPRPDAPRYVAGAAAVAQAANVVHIVVADPPAVNSVLDAIVGELGPGHLVIQSATIDGGNAEGFAARVGETGAAYVEAPFMGSKPIAEARKNVFMLGGEPAAIRRAEAVLAHVSEVRHCVGSPRQAASLKLACNVLVAVMMEGLCESVATARHAGLDDEAVFGVLRSTTLWSGFWGLKEPKFKSNDYAPQFSVKHLHKDMRLATAGGGEIRAPAATLIRDRLRRLEELGLAEEDMMALFKLL